jgi:UDP-N-acetylmuramoyl-tripeptide--D-alanyl-D-alanine ligase
VIPRRADELAAAIGGRLVDGDPAALVTGTSIDSRRIRPRDAFFAIVGEHHDGHAFVEQALAAGASAAVTDRDLALDRAAPTVRVDDTTVALGRLAADERRRRDLLVVAITGSAGKTTTRTLTAAALGARYRTGGTTGNLNNQWGLPLSILDLPDGCEAAVLELGMNHSGEIAALTRIAAPDAGVITNVGLAHIGFFSGIEEIAAAKGELLEEMPAGATGVIDADMVPLQPIAARSGRRILRFALDRTDADLTGRILSTDLLGGTRLVVDGEQVHLQLWGRHAALNALAALGAARALGMPTAEAAPALAAVAPLPGRGRIHRLEGGVVLVDESYNANPEAMKAVLASLGAARPAGRRIAVLGDMLELGAQAERLHRDLGAEAVRQGFASVYVVGEQAPNVDRGARDAGGDPVAQSPDADAAASAVTAALADGDLVVVKGSRSIGLDRVVQAVLAARGGEAPR